MNNTGHVTPSFLDERTVYLCQHVVMSRFDLVLAFGLCPLLDGVDKCPAKDQELLGDATPESALARHLFGTFPGHFKRSELQHAFGKQPFLHGPSTRM